MVLVWTKGENETSFSSPTDMSPNSVLCRDRTPKVVSRVLMPLSEMSFHPLSVLLVETSFKQPTFCFSKEHSFSLL